jgi:virginiamycin B lyase
VRLLRAGAILCSVVFAACSSMRSGFAPNFEPFTDSTSTNGTWQMFAITGYPQGIVRAKNGDFWVADGDMTYSLSRITPQGKVTVFQIGYTPLEMTQDRSGNFWLTTAVNLNQVIRVTPNLKVTSYALGDDTDGGIILGQDGNIWFAENNHIGRLTPAGKLTEYPTPQTQGETGLAWAPDGLIWFCAANPTGRGWVLTSFDPKTGAVKAFKAYTTAGAIVATADGSLWYISSSARTFLEQFDPSTDKLHTYAAPSNFRPYSAPAGMTLAPDGSLWYTAQRIKGRRYEKRVVGGGFVRFDTTTRRFTTYATPKGYSWLWDLVVAPDGKVWGTQEFAVDVLDPSS